MTAPEIKPSRHGQSLLLTLSAPEHRNALGPEIYAQGMAALRQAEADPGTRSVVLVGEGAMFCAGGNLHRLQGNRQQPPAVQAASIDGLNAWIAALRAFPKPVIAAVEGAAAGAGFSLALACDFIVAASDAQFVMAYTSIALSPDGGGSWSLARALPRQLATQLMMCGERIGAQRLFELGVVNRVAPAGQALAQALELAAQLNARAPNALASVKQLVNSAAELPLAQQLELERDHFVRNLHHPNAGAGINAFLDKQTPSYE